MSALELQDTAAHGQSDLDVAGGPGEAWFQGDGFWLVVWSIKGMGFGSFQKMGFGPSFGCLNSFGKDGKFLGHFFCFKNSTRSSVSKARKVKRTNPFGNFVFLSGKVPTTTQVLAYFVDNVPAFKGSYASFNASRYLKPVESFDQRQWLVINLEHAKHQVCKKYCKKPTIHVFSNSLVFLEPSGIYAHILLRPLVVPPWG